MLQSEKVKWIQLSSRLSQISHGYGFSPEWRFMCDLRRLLLLLKRLPHRLQLSGLSSEWLSLWTVRSWLWLHAFPQISHWYGVSHVWVRTWSTRWSLLLNVLPHSWQGNSFMSRVLSLVNLQKTAIAKRVATNFTKTCIFVKMLQMKYQQFRRFEFCLTDVTVT